jgi:hypothetical protein
MTSKYDEQLQEDKSRGKRFATWTLTKEVLKMLTAEGEH